MKTIGCLHSAALRRTVAFVLALLLCIGNSSRAEGAAAGEETSDDLVNLVVGLLHDSDKDIHALAWEQVRSEAKGAAATKVFAAQLTKLPPDAQVGLLSALADRGDGAARPAVLELLGAAMDADVKVESIAALGALGGPDDTEPLVRLLGSESQAERDAARKSLVRLSGEPVPQLLAAQLKSAKPPVRLALIEILAARRGLEAIPDILAVATQADPAARAAAMQALGQMAGPKDIPGLVRGVLAAEPGKERDTAEKCVALVCHRIEDADQRAKPLLAAMDELPPAEQADMLSTLGRVGGPAALQRIEAMIGESAAARHEVGVRALCNWPDASVAPRLMELASSESNDALRIAALRALIRVTPLADDRTDQQRLDVLKKAMAMATRDDERLLTLDRARTIKTVDALRFIVPYLDQPKYAEQACLCVVELAHHRTLRQPNKKEFDQALDKVIATSQDEVVIDRAQRYKKDQTWVRPKGK